jgi:hypothetical protein
LLDATFALESPSPAVQGSFSDPTFLRGTYLVGAAGTFEAASDMPSASTYKFVGTYFPNNFYGHHSPWPFMVLGVDESKHVSGIIGSYILQGMGNGHNVHRDGEERRRPRWRSGFWNFLEDEYQVHIG